MVGTVCALYLKALAVVIDLFVIDAGTDINGHPFFCMADGALDAGEVVRNVDE